MDTVTKPRAATARTKTAKPRFATGARGRGLAQLSLVEHALCPLGAGSAPGNSQLFETAYSYTDTNRHRKRANVRVMCPAGLSPTDELYLWGLLSLTFSQPKPAMDFFATPYYCLRQLGLIDAASGHGGKNFQLFRDALRRLAAVSYASDAFYDPVRGEHRDAAFGFLSYSLPLDPASSRAWRIAWDPIFFEFCSAAGGALQFDLHAYRHLDPATRRLYLLLKKVFWRREHSPTFEVRNLAVNVVGFADTHPTKELKRRLIQCAAALVDHQMIRLPHGAASPSDLFVRLSKGHFIVQFHRGPHFDRAPLATRNSQLGDSPLYEPLQRIGLDDKAIRCILDGYDARLVAEISDMTLAASEKYGPSFFKTSPQAYFVDNLKAQANRERTPPDWWRAFRKEEEKKQCNASTALESDDDAFERQFDAYLANEARDTFASVMQKTFATFKAAGQSDVEARENARHHARTHFRHRFSAARTDQPGDVAGPRGSEA